MLRTLPSKFLKLITISLIGIALTLTIGACERLSQFLPVASPTATPTEPATVSPAAGSTFVELPALPYAYNALEPYIDAQTMEIHHSKHHAAYVNKLNEVIQQYPDLQTQTVVSLLQSLESLPEEIRSTIRNNGGGHLNHSMFWQIMAPNSGGTPSGELATALDQTFGSFDAFKQQFNQAGAGQFGSGWVWLAMNPQGQLQIVTTSNQDSPILENLYPILGNDVWEHAYYLQYQNRRPEYLDRWWNVVNWPEVERRFAQAQELQQQLAS
ncbi:MAG: superoxide dismutase [Synechococcales cyanobacterium M58_A2018_015]|nr:superoxide dismutase [Synechococcales cyanobacterium M58_A2018_015]